MLASAYLGFVPNGLRVSDLEKLMLPEQGECRRVALQMVEDGDLEVVPYFVRQARDLRETDTNLLAIPQTFSDVLCKARPAVDVIAGNRRSPRRPTNIFAQKHQSSRG